MSITAHIRTSFSHIGEIDPVFHPAELTLLLGISKGNLRYFVKSDIYGRIVYYGHHTLHHVNNENELAETISDLVKKDEVLALGFGKVYAGVDSSYTIVPVELSFLYNEDGQVKNEINGLGINLAFEASTQLQYAIRAAFGNVEIQHLNTTLLKQLSQTLDYNDKVFVNINHESFDLLKFENSSLKLINTYNFKAPQDFIYFVLLCCDELKINRETTELVLMGEIDRKSNLYDICNKYFMQVTFVNAPAGLSFSNAFEDFAPHLYYNIYTLGE